VLKGELFRAMGGVGPFASLTHNSSSYTVEFKSRLALLASAGKLELNDLLKEIDEQIAQEGYGDIVGNYLYIKCELVRQLLVRKILKPPPIAEYPPYPFSIVTLLETALAYFSPSHVSRAFHNSTKIASTTNAENTSTFKCGSRVPKDAVYQVELFRVLHQWLEGLEDVAISNDVDAVGYTKKSLDFLYTEMSEPQRKYAIELAASTHDSDLDEHANRRQVFVTSLIKATNCKSYQLWTQSWCCAGVYCALYPSQSF